MPPRPTALITGASSGIGRELAFCAAADGYDLILTGRNAAELASTSSQVEDRQPGTKVHTFLADLSTETGAQGLIDDLRAAGLPVDVLVNNAGFGVHGNFVETSIDEERALTGVHIIAPWLLTKALLPAMVERGFGGVLNVGSVYSFSTAPWQALYGAAKSWQLSFSLALREEVRGTGVKISTLCPGTTLSQFRERFGHKDKASWFTLTPAEVAQAAWEALQADRAVVVPGLYYKLYVALARRLPASWLGHFVYLSSYKVRNMAVHRLPQKSPE